jgi:hypothetical protein
VYGSEDLKIATTDTDDMAEPRPRSPGNAEKGPSRHSPRTDSSASLPGGLEDPEKQSREDIGHTLSETDGDEDGQTPLSRPRTREDEQQDDTAGAGPGVLSRAVSRVITRASTKSSWNPGPPPDGGWRAWIAGMYTVHSTPSSP